VQAGAVRAGPAHQAQQPGGDDFFFGSIFLFRF